MCDVARLDGSTVYHKQRDWLGFLDELEIVLFAEFSGDEVGSGAGVHQCMSGHYRASWMGAGKLERDD